MANINKENILTQEYVKELFDYKDGILYWKIKKYRMYPGDVAGNYNQERKRYHIKINQKLYATSRLIFLYCKGYLPKVVDHINRNSEDNRIENLREANLFTNAQNRKSNKNSASKYLGVSYSKRDKIWFAQICHERIRTHLGSFKSEILAALEYNKAAVKYHGEFANINIIKL